MEKDVSRINERRNSSFEFEKKYLDRMKKKYNLSDVGNVQVIDMLKEKISAGAKKTVLREGATLTPDHQNTVCNKPETVLPET